MLRLQKGEPFALAKPDKFTINKHQGSNLVRCDCGQITAMPPLHPGSGRDGIGANPDILLTVSTSIRDTLLEILDCQYLATSFRRRNCMTCICIEAAILFATIKNKLSYSQ